MCGKDAAGTSASKRVASRRLRMIVRCVYVTNVLLAVFVVFLISGGCADPLGVFNSRQTAVPSVTPTTAAEAKPLASEPVTDPDVARQVDEYLAVMRRMHTTKQEPVSGMKRNLTVGAENESKEQKTITGDVAGAVPGEAVVATTNTPLSTVEPVVSEDRAASPPSRPTAPAAPVLLSVRVDEPDTGALPANDDVTTGVSNQALDVRAEPKRKTVEEYLADLERRSSQPGGEDAAWRWLMIRTALEGEPPPAKMLERLPGAQRAALSELFDLACAVRGVMRDPASSADDAMDSARRLERALGEFADLRIARLELCTRVLTFGVFETMPAEQFVAGKANQTILYCEVGNFASEVDGEGKYRSRFASRVEVLTPTGQSVFSHEEPLIEDRCRRRRTDFFIAQRITLPATLPPGDYTLKVTLEDKLANRVNESSIPLTLRSASSLARNE